MDKPLLDLYADYLISSFGPTTATGLSRLLGAGLSHDKITRFLSERTFTSANLWQVVKPLVRTVQKDDAVLVIDDSIVHKPHTDPSELIGWHYDHTTGTSVKGINFLTTLVKGINFLTTLYCTDDVSLPVAFALVEKDEEFTDEEDRQDSSEGRPSARTNTTAPCSKPASRTGCRSATSSTTCGSRRQTT